MLEVDMVIGKDLGNEALDTEPSFTASSLLGFDVELFRLLLASISAGLTSLPSAFLLAMGHDNPRNLPRLATPTPQVKVVL
jgi:hypothetical protein